MEYARQIAVQGFGVGAMLGVGPRITKDAPDAKLALERSKQLTLKRSKRPVPQPKG
jgi:bifunctional N-acetylglucosamine-1-phosphate-uridyltransferase/glucosamine-1-phosphate-acetyltransferase GlmU-like protein